MATSSQKSLKFIAFADQTSTDTNAGVRASFKETLLLDQAHFRAPLRSQ